MKQIIGFILVILGIGAFFYVMYSKSQTGNVTRTFSPYSPYTTLSSSWEKYKHQFIQKDGRVIDYSQNAITTSEGQSYGMLRAVWMDDKETFNLVWKWTKENLKHKNDHLFGWRWGKRNDGSYGFIPGGGENSASDAESDIALALILASRRWSDPKYNDEAKPILKDLWDINTDLVAGKRYVVAGNWAKDSQRIIINPSYFAPYAWRIFARVDKERDWNSLIDPSYELLKKVGDAPLDRGKSVGLPPDWFALRRSDGDIQPANLPNLTSDYSYDAIRIPWRIALDYQWNQDKEAYDYLLSSFKRLSEYYEKENKLIIPFSHDGTPLSNNENPTIYATALGYFMVVKPELAEKIYQEKIIKLYSNDKNTFREDLPYYEQNWLWFGVALYHKQLLHYEN